MFRGAKAINAAYTPAAAHNSTVSKKPPRYLRALRNFDTSITRLDLNGLGVDAHDIRLFSIPLISGHTRVTELYLEGNQIGVEGSTAILNLDGNNITSVGIYALRKCIYDTSNMHSLWDSNHTLRSFFGPRPIHSRTFPETVTNKRLAQQLREILAMNRYYYSMPIYRHISARLVRKISSRIAAYKYCDITSRKMILGRSIANSSRGWTKS